MSIVVITYLFIICCLSIVGHTDFFTKLDESYNSKVKKDALQWQERLGDLGLQLQPSLPVEHPPGPLIHKGKVRKTVTIIIIILYFYCIIIIIIVLLMLSLCIFSWVACLLISSCFIIIIMHY